MKAKRKAPSKKKVVGPRSAAAAKRAGHKRVKVKFKNLSSAAKKKARYFSAAGARINLGRAFRDALGPNGETIRCFFDPNTGEFDICHEL